MVRPNPGGGENEVSDSSPSFCLIDVVYSWSQNDYNLFHEWYYI